VSAGWGPTPWGGWPTGWRASGGSGRRASGASSAWTSTCARRRERSGSMSDMKVVADPGTQEIVITRSFDAPRERVFKAFTDPEAVGQWWGLDSTETVVDQLEARAGGRWRFVEREGDGSEYGFHGVYHD